MMWIPKKKDNYSDNNNNKTIKQKQQKNNKNVYTCRESILKEMLKGVFKSGTTILLQ